MVFFKLARKDFEVDHAVLVTGITGGGFAVEPAASKHRRVLDRREIAVPGVARLRGKRERVRFAPAAGEDHLLRTRRRQGPQPYRAPPRSRPAPPVPPHAPRTDCRRGEGRDHRLAHLGPERSGRVIVEISALVMSPKLAADGTAGLALARAPIARAMKRGLKSEPLKVPSLFGAALFGTILILVLYRIPGRPESRFAAAFGFLSALPRNAVLPFLT